MHKWNYDTLGAFWEKNGTINKLKAMYREQINAEYNWDKIKEQIDAAEPQEDEFLFDADCYYKCIFIGTVFNMTPSGKFYVPFARSNVTDKEGLKDEIWRETMEEILEEHDLYMMNGEGCSTDIFFCYNIPSEILGV
jgi:hypothetical protein